MNSTTVVTIPWRTVADLRWGPSRAAAPEASHFAELRSTLIADLIHLRRWGARGDSDVETRWLYRHPDTHDFLNWCESIEGLTARQVAKHNAGEVLDVYLAELWGE